MSGQVASDPRGRQIVVLAYSRLSDDPQGRKITHSTQRDAVNALLPRYDLPAITEWFTDTDKSASDEKVTRLGYVRLLKAIESYHASRYCVVVVAYKQDRLLRQMAETQQLGRLLGVEKAGRLITHAEGEITISKGGRQGFILSGALGTIETESTSIRTSDGIEGAAKKGMAHGPKRYGWTREYRNAGAGRPEVYEVIDEDEATVIRDAAARILRGDSLRAIVADLNEAGVPSPGAGRVMVRDETTREPLRYAEDQWAPQTLRQILVRKSNVGIRQHVAGKGELQSVSEYPAQWAAILTDDTYNRMMAILSDPSRRTILSNTTKYLLSGIATCGVCGGRVTMQKSKSGAVSKVTGKRETKLEVYRCAKSHVVKSRWQTDEAVRREVLHLFSQPEFRVMLSESGKGEATEALAQEAAILARKSEAAEMFATGEIDRASLRTINERIARDLKACQRTSAKSVDAAVYAELLSAEDVWTAWDDETSIECKRSIIRTLFTVELHKSSRTGRAPFDIESVHISLRD